MLSSSKHKSKNQRFKLSWHKARKCWKKMYKGKTYYLGKGNCSGKTDVEGYRWALAEWDAVKRHADNAGPSPYGSKGNFSPQNYAMRLAEFLNINQLSLANVVRTTEDEVGEGASVQMVTDYSRHDFSPVFGRRAPTEEITLEELFAEYQQERRAKVLSRSLSSQQFAQDKAKFADFEAYAKSEYRYKLSQVDDPLLKAYRDGQHALVGHDNPKDRISSETARKRLQTVAKVWKWAYREGYLEHLPRIFDNEFAKVKIAPPTPRFWQAYQLQSLYQSASKRSKLYIKLACNLGYTQSEISELTWEMIDQDTLEVRRYRPKSNTSQVHRLWPSTFELLKDESKTRTGLCLLTEGDKPLVRKSLKEDGNLRHIDAIGLAITRVLKKTKLIDTGLRFKHIRKTSANAIAEHFGSYELIDLFLANGEYSVRRHYVTKHYGRLFEAVDWLEEFYDLEGTKDNDEEE